MACEPAETSPKREIPQTSNVESSSDDGEQKGTNEKSVLSLPAILYGVEAFAAVATPGTSVDSSPES